MGVSSMQVHRRQHGSVTRARACLGAALVAAAASATLAAGAQAAPAFHCEASALRATLGGTQTIEPVTQGRTGDCATGAGTPSLALPPLLNASALIAQTTFTPSAGAGQANGGIAHLDVLPAPEIIAQGQAQVISAINALPLQPIKLANPLVGLPIPGLSSLTSVTLDVRGALLGLIPAAIPSLLSADVLNAQANVACQAGAAAFSGASNVLGVKVLGQDLGADGLVNALLPLFNSGSISPAQLLAAIQSGAVKVYDPTGLIHIAGAALTPVLAQLGALPAIPIPNALASVTITPNEQIREGDSLTQRALHATISLAGQPVLDAVLGEAKVSAAPGTCAPAPAPAPPAPAPVATVTKPTPAQPVAAQGSPAQQLLACSDRKLILVDVLKEGDHVKLLGAANRAYVGKKVAIRLRATGNVVAHARVQKDGSFQTTAPMPPSAFLATHKKANSVRYRAEIGKELSLPLKLQRRLVVSSLTSKNGKVTVAGRVTGTLTKPIADVRLVRRVSCHKVVLVKRFKPNADGTFRVTVKAPAGQAAAVYRLATDVREKPSNPRTYPTFTLPRGVALNSR
jgi:hypothetical protein